MIIERVVAIIVKSTTIKDCRFIYLFIDLKPESFRKGMIF